MELNPEKQVKVIKVLLFLEKKANVHKKNSTPNLLHFYN